MSVDLQTAPIGTPHAKATCCWCDRSLVVGQVEDRRCWLCPVDWPRQEALALYVTPKGGKKTCLNVPLPSQAAFEECTAKNVLWGGMAGPGKSHGVRWWLYKRSLTIPNHKAVLLRENSKQLETTHLFDMRRELPLFGGRLVDETARFPNGSEVHCGHMADADAVQRYLGTEYGAIVADEASLYPVDPQGVTTLSELSTRARKDFIDVNGHAVSPRFMAVTNPGGPSASWLLDMFIDRAPDLEKFPALRPVFDELGVHVKGYRAEQWQFIAAKLKDNPYMREDYAETDLAVLGATRYRQLAEGDWRAFSGQFFEEWDEKIHVRALRHLDLRAIECFGAMDWGYNAPGCFGLWLCLPDGHYHIRKELKFQRKNAPEVAVEIKALLKNLGVGRLRYLVADPAMWQHTGAGRGEAIAETLARLGLPMKRGDNDRFNGWQRCHELFRLAPDGTPWLTVDEDCRYLRRTIPAAVSDKADLDDVDTKIDDHGLDMMRYGAMSRPSPTRFSTHKELPKHAVGRLFQQAREAAVA